MDTKKIGLRKTSENSFEVTPCEVQFAGFTVTIGNGIKRSFSELSLNFQDPCDKYIEQFFSLELKSLFGPFENSKLFAQFAEDSNNFFCRFLYVLAFKLISEELHHKPSENVHINLADDSQLYNTFNAKLEPSLGKINVIGCHSNLSRGEKMAVLRSIHDIVCEFISDLLVATNQINFKLTDKVINQNLHRDRDSGGTSASFLTAKAWKAKDGQ